MRWIPGGSFLMGSDLIRYPEEGPSHEVWVDGFWIDETPVTVADFRRFVRATGYVTVAERVPDAAGYPKVDPATLRAGSLVFVPTAGPVGMADFTRWWRYVLGASWAHPEGARSSASGREHHPAVHVAWADVAAFADWAGKEIPTEAEWEYAARGGLRGALYTWGNDLSPKGRRMANVWEGNFPWRSLKPVDQMRTSQVRSFPPNGYGLYDMAGNVWEWTSDFYTTSHVSSAPCCPTANPRRDSAEGSYQEREASGSHTPRRVAKGGSHLCSADYCWRYRPAARQPQMVDTGMSHLGFRCVRRP